MQSETHNRFIFNSLFTDRIAVIDFSIDLLSMRVVYHLRLHLQKIIFLFSMEVLWKAIRAYLISNDFPTIINGNPSLTG